jgi:hypothetical protein
VLCYVLKEDVKDCITTHLKKDVKDCKALKQIPSGVCYLYSAMPKPRIPINSAMHHRPRIVLTSFLPAQPHLALFSQLVVVFFFLINPMLIKGNNCTMDKRTI